MQAVIVYESVYGNTRWVADAAGAGLNTAFDVRPANAVAVDWAGYVTGAVVWD